MKQSIKMTIVLVSIVSTGFIINPGSRDAASLIAKAEPFCRFEGSYILEPAGGAAPFGLDMAIPLDPKNERVALIHEVANYDVTFGGIYPNAVRLTAGHGEARRTGPRTFDYTLHFWSLDRNNQRVSLIVSSGSKLLSETDCDQYITTGGTLSVYAAFQDANNDGFPDAGQLPKLCLPMTCKAKRVNIISPCKL